jgi:hypothetical protein
MAYKYPNRQEELLAKVKGKTGKISDKTHEEHMKLYTGYVNKTNAILEELPPIPPSPIKYFQPSAASRSISPLPTAALSIMKSTLISSAVMGNLPKRSLHRLMRASAHSITTKKTSKPQGSLLAAGCGLASITSAVVFSTISAMRRILSQFGASLHFSP